MREASNRGRPNMRDGDVFPFHHCPSSLHHQMATPTELTYEMNERVLCYHGPLIYEAKVLKPPVVHTEETAPPSGPGPYYFVHYKGWKQTYVWRHHLLNPPTWLFFCRWDEWVPVSRLLKYNEQNIATQKTLQATAYPHGQSGSGRGPLIGSNAGPVTGVGRSSGLKSGAGSRGGARKDGAHGGRGQKRIRDEVRFSFPCSDGRS